MSTPPAAVTNETPSRRGVVLAGAVVLALAATAAVLVWRGAERGETETTAWQDREDLEVVLEQTARVAGITGVVEPGPQGPMPCTRNDGRSGVFYRLTTLVSDEPADVEHVMTAVEQQWTDLGYAVEMASPGVLAATTPQAASLSVAASDVGVRLGGWTGCALRDGAP